MCTRARLAVLATALVLSASACGRPAPAPNFVVISVDTLRRDALRAYDPGAPALPHLDALAARSVRFTHALAPAAWTLPSHASLLTGVYPNRHGAVHRDATIARAAPALAGLLSRRGYETVAFTDGGFLDTTYGFGRGFERFDDRLSRGIAPLPGLPRGGKPGEAGDSDLFARADAYLAQRAPGRPLFLFAHTYAVHDYYQAHAWARPPAGGDSAADGARNLDCLVGKARCKPEQWAALGGYYRGELRRLDDAVGRLLAATRQALGDRPTYVVLLSDHGEGLDPSSGATHHGGALSREVVAVPLLVAGPRLAARDVATPVSLVDVAPTLLALAGGDSPRRGRFDGRSLAPLLGGGARASLAALMLGRRSLRAEEHSYWWRDGRRYAARQAGTRPVTVGLLRHGWWYSSGPAGELAERLTGEGSGPPPLPALRRAAAPLLRAAAVTTAPHEESAELRATLQSLGYGGGGP
jgi:arylsulfatase A-like enzyme